MIRVLSAILGSSISVSIKMSTLLPTLVVALAVFLFYSRHRSSRKYSRLSRNLDGDEKESEAIVTDMWNEPDDSDTESLVTEKSNLSHFDEFLKAIKVFGFLDHDVFNELTKSTQTVRFQRGERVKLADLRGFAVIISGAMKLYSKSSDKSDDEYDLLNEVYSPAPISSLSSILSLFSDEVSQEPAPNDSEFDKVNASIVGVASELCTVVIIPSEAFRKLTRKFPRATANIVQIILFRWSQVTFRTCQKYLNLTLQFYGTERLLNKSAQARDPENSLPSLLVNDVLAQMRHLIKENPESKVVTLEGKRQHARNAPIEFGAVESVLGRANRSVSVDLLSDMSRNSSEFPGTLLSHAQLNYNSGVENVQRKTPGPSDDSASYTSGNSFSSRSSLFAGNAGGSGSSTPSVGSPSLHSVLSEAKTYRLGQSLNEDTEQKALRRAIVERMFSIVTIDPNVFVVNSVFESLVDDDKERDSSEDEHSVYCMYAFDQDSGEKTEPGSEGQRTPEDTPTSPRTHGPTASSSYGDIIEDASNMVEIVWYREGEYLSKTGERSRGLIYVLDGCLEVGHHHHSSYERLYDVGRGHITGFLETISSYTAFVDLKAKRDSCVAIISRDYFDRLSDSYPLVSIFMARALTRSLTQPLVQLDFALEWISVKSGGKLLSEGAKTNAVYFVLNGRLRAYKNRKQIGDYGHGSTVGELEMMSNEKSSATVVAVRDTELSRFPKTLVQCLCRQYPSITFEMSRIVQQAMRARTSSSDGFKTQIVDFKTVAILPTTSKLPVEDFAIKLSRSFESIGREVKVLTNSVILRFLGKYSFQKMGTLKLKAYLADLEDRYDLLLYVADDSSSTQWFKTCIDQADCVLLLADGNAAPKFSDVERMVVKSPTRSRAHLILLHTDQMVPRGSTAKWLKNRPWISAHHHIQMAFLRNAEEQAPMTVGKNKMKETLTSIKNLVQDEIRFFQQKKILNDFQRTSTAGTAHLEYKNDFNRLARVLAGEAIGLVLGGGGARGVSHVGVIRALEEAGIPIDMIGGTSIGSLIGGLYAKDYNVVQLIGRAKKFATNVSSIWRMFLDLTYPVTAWTTGHAFNQAVWHALGDSRIEDFWIKYFTNTTNLTHSRMEVHQNGYSWRYVRASMSLAGLLPPIEDRGNLLLDGGYVDNLPVNEMKRMGAKYIIAVDVGAVDDTKPYQYGDSVSGFYALINRMNPFSTRRTAPNIAEIQQRLTYVSSVKALEEAKTEANVLYLRPPIDNYATLDFKKFDEIMNVGFSYGMAKLQGDAAKKHPFLNNKPKDGNRVPVRHRRYSM